MNNIKLFQEKKIRSVWNEEEQQWYFSVVDVVGVLTDSVNPTDYLKKMRKRDEELATYLRTTCPQVEMVTDTGKNEKRWRQMCRLYSVSFNLFLLLKLNLSSFG